MTRTLRRLPRHIGIIPDGNRRWAQAQGSKRSEGYEAGVDPALKPIDLCRQLGDRRSNILRLHEREMSAGRTNR